MIKLNDDEAFEASTKRSSSDSDSHEDGKEDTTTDTSVPKQQGGSWCWMLPEDGTHYRRLDFIPDGSNFDDDGDYGNGNNDPPDFVPSNDEPKNDHELSDTSMEEHNSMLNNANNNNTTVGNRTIQYDDSPAIAASNDRGMNSIATVGGCTPATMDTTPTRKRKPGIEFEPNPAPAAIGKSTPTLLRPRRHSCSDVFEGCENMDRDSAEINNDDSISDNNSADEEVGCDTNNRACRPRYVSSKLDHKWMKNYQDLVAYKKKHGTTCIPHICNADPELGQWVRNQRRICKKKARIDLLNDIGIECCDSTNNGDNRPRYVSSKLDNQWMKRYQDLVAYKNIHGTSCVPQIYKADPALGLWVRNQRRTCKLKARVDLLNDIGFKWQLVEKIDWGVMLQRLLTYKKKYGTTRVPQDFKEDPQLRVWVKNQRQRKSCKYRIEILNKIGFEWSIPIPTNFTQPAPTILQRERSH